MRVPTDFTPNVAPEAMPGVRVEPVSNAQGVEALGSGLEQLGQGVTRGADDIIKAQMRGKRRADGIAAANALTQLKHDTTTVSYSNPSTDDPAAPTSNDPAEATIKEDGTAPNVAYGPSQKAADAVMSGTNGLSQKGFLNERGMNASKFLAPSLDWIQQRADELSQSLPNDDAKALFQKMAGGHVEETRQMYLRHRGQQMQVAAEDSKKAALGVGLASLSQQLTAPNANYGDMIGALDGAVKSGTLAIKSIDDGPAGDLQAQEYKATATGNVLQHLIDTKDAKGAQMFFQARRGDLGKQAEHFEKTVKVLGDQQDAQDTADTIITGATDKETGLFDHAQAISDFVALPPEKRTKAAEDAVNKGLAMGRESNTSTVAFYFNKAMGAYNKNHSLSDVDPDTQAWLSNNAGLKWHELEQIDLQHQRETAPRGGKKSDEITPQQVALGRLLADMGSKGDEYAAMPYDQFLSGFAGKLDSRGFKTASDKFAELKAAAARPDKDTTLPTNAQRVVLEMGHGTLWNKEEPTKMNDDAAAAYQKVTDSAEQFRKTFKASHKGNEPTTEDYKAALAPQFRSVPVPGMIYGTNDIPAVKYETSSKYKGKTLAVPDDFAAQAQAKAKARGKVLTPDLLSAAYLEYAKAGGNEAKPSGAPDAAAPAPKADPFEFDNPAVRRVLDPFGYHEGPQVTVPTLSASVGATPPTLSATVAPTAPAPKAKKGKGKKAAAPDESLQSVMDGIVKSADTNQGGT